MSILIHRNSNLVLVVVLLFCLCQMTLAQQAQAQTQIQLRECTPEERVMVPPCCPMRNPVFGVFCQAFLAVQLQKHQQQQSTAGILQKDETKYSNNSGGDAKIIHREYIGDKEEKEQQEAAVSTEQQSESPSERPSSKPSVIPSLAPSDMPSHTPSSKPTVTPSVTPSSKPSVTPSSTPSVTPSTTAPTRNIKFVVADNKDCDPMEKAFAPDCCPIRNSALTAFCHSLFERSQYVSSGMIEMHKNWIGSYDIDTDP